MVGSFVCFDFEASKAHRASVSKHVAVRVTTATMLRIRSCTVWVMTGTSDDALDPQQLGAYFALMEAVGLLEHRVEQHLRADGGISYVQFQLLARLANADGHLTMTQLADGVVYSRSGLTYQAGLLEKAGLIIRATSADDERATLVTITDAGLALFARVLPGHVEVVRGQLLAPLSTDDLRVLGDIMTRVRDHMRDQPPRSATPRKRRPSTPPTPA
jgi:DNA-binding MarR family transcriptional regulator